MVSISARIPDDDGDELERVAEILDLDKSTTIRKALKKGLREMKIDHSVKEYQSGDLSVNQAASVAGVSVADWLKIARERNLTTQLTKEDLETDAETALEI